MRGGGALPDFLFCSLFPVQQTPSGIGHRVKKQFFGLATNTLNARNNNKNNNYRESAVIKPVEVIKVARVTGAAFASPWTNESAPLFSHIYYILVCSGHVRGMHNVAVVVCCVYHNN